MVEAAWVAVEHHPHWKAQFERLAKRDRLLLLYEQLDRLGLSEEVEQVDYYGSTYRLSTKQKLIRATQHRKET
jgi:hypothetical protein